MNGGNITNKHDDFSDELNRLIAGKPYVVDGIGLSGAEVRIYDEYVLKIRQPNIYADNETKILTWLNGRENTPKPIYSGIHGGKDHLLMSRVKGIMSCDFTDELEYLVTMPAKGLERLHSMDITDCPVSGGLDSRLAAARYNVEHGLCTMENVQPDTYGKDGFSCPKELLDWLCNNRPEEDVAFIHGDYCLPNVLLDGDNIGFIDLDHAGTGDRWADIALCWRSLKDNFNGSYGGKIYPDFDLDILFDKLKISPDREKLRYYILLDELF